MLRLAKGTEAPFLPKGRAWLVESQYLRQRGLRSPQGFTFEVSHNIEIGNFFWTSNPFAAFLFYKRHGGVELDVEKKFQIQARHEEYLYNLSSAVTTDKEFKCRDGVKYRDYQKVTIEYGLAVDSLLIADQQRVGKTAGALGIINNREADRVIIVGPKTAIPGWYVECKAWLVKVYKIQTLEAHSILDPTADIHLVHYDILDRFPGLRDLKADILIADEVHLCRNIKANCTQRLFAIPAKHRLGLTGTALPNVADDFLTILKWIDPFWADWVVRKDVFTHKSGLTLTLAEVQETARSTCMVRRVQADVFKNEPLEKRLIVLDPPEEYKELITADRLKLADYGGERKRKLGLSKLRYALKYIDTYTADGSKLVVFAHHTELIDRLAMSLGNKAVVLYGNSSTANREEAKARFKDDLTCTVFIGSLGAASMALNLSAASHILYVEQDWRAENMEQSIDRCSDLLQDKQVLVELLVYKNSLDEDMGNNLLRKANLSDTGLNK